jgi:hypothetical protein
MGYWLRTARMTSGRCIYWGIYCREKVGGAFAICGSTVAGSGLEVLKVGGHAGDAIQEPPSWSAVLDATPARATRSTSQI